MKNILLTGATRGLGLAIAQRLVRDGYKVIGIARNNSRQYEELQDTPGNGEAHFVTLDLSNIDEIPPVVSDVVKEHGALYGVINNAAIGLDGLLATQHNSEIHRTLAINLEAAIIMAKYGCRSMLSREEGRIINISSITASTGFNGLSVYAATKAGLEGFSRSLSRELGRLKITVNCVAPGYMETDMTAGLESEKLDSIKRRAPLGLPRVEKVAGAVAYLLSDDASDMTGTTITIDGGSTA